MFEVFDERKDGWQITMKMFQNVGDNVRDLLSPTAEEHGYKNGMRKDPDGFMDIEWCSRKVLHGWDDLRTTFQIASARKSIVSTQYNHMSTCGHVIIMLEIEMPNFENGIKTRGRLCVCDLAGMEPSGDLVCAQYKTITFDDGAIEYKYMGQHPDQNKTKEIQEQGKKSNLSLTELSQFFMKMAEAVQKKKLKPGATIPGCNSFFLCKYIKDTILLSNTYLFCAIRPEVTYSNYTFATLTFASHASMVKVAPKNVAVAVAPIESKESATAETSIDHPLQNNENQNAGKSEQEKAGEFNGDAHGATIRYIFEKY